MEIYTEANEARRWEHIRFVWLVKVIAHGTAKAEVQYLSWKRPMKCEVRKDNGACFTPLFRAADINANESHWMSEWVALQYDELFCRRKQEPSRVPLSLMRRLKKHICLFWRQWQCKHMVACHFSCAKYKYKYKWSISQSVNCAVTCKYVMLFTCSVSDDCSFLHISLGRCWYYSFGIIRL